MSSLPSEKGWVVSRIYKFQGVWHTPAMLQGILNCQKHFQAKDSDIYLVTIPKSGTTLLKALVFAHLNRQKYAVSSALQSSSSHALLGRIYLKESDFPEDLPSPRLLSTHSSHLSLPESATSSSCKIVYCCRDPKDMFVSLWQFGKKLATQETADYPIEDTVEVFCKGEFIGGPFWENPEKVLFLTYEALKKQNGAELKRISEFLGKER